MVFTKCYNQHDKIIREIRLKLYDTMKEIKAVPIKQEYKFDLMVDLIEK